MVHSGCDIINDIYDIDIDRISKPKGAVVSGAIPLKIAWVYMGALFFISLIISLWLSPVLFLSFIVGIIVGGIMYSHPIFRLKDTPGVAMIDMALCFSLESLGVWSIYSPLNFNSLIVAAYIFVLAFSLTFMKDFKDVAGDKNSLPLLLGIGRAAKVCSVLAVLPLVPLIFLVIKYPFIVPSAIIYVLLVAGCIRILLGDPVKNGVKLKNWMIMAMVIPNFIMLMIGTLALFWKP
jgi:4-hydroxybenzoate polyprenyltransferase